MRAPDDTVTAQGLTVPAFGYGTWELTPEVAERGVRDALELGYRHVDTAAMYGNEEAVGRAIRDGEVDRDQVHLTTKVQPQHARYDDVIGAAEASLRRLGLDHVDLLLIHWPTDLAPIEETIEGLTAVQEREWTRSIGVSNHTADQLRTAVKAGPVVTNQVEYHPFLSQEHVLQACREAGVFLTAYSPLAKGRVLDSEVLAEIGEEVGRGPAEVALRWLLDHGDVAVLPRSSNRDHIASNCGVDFELTSEQRARIEQLPKDQRLIDPPMAPEWDPT